MISFTYAYLRAKAILKKELIHVREDMGTYLMLILSPLLQVILFGYIINNDPKHLPTVVLSNDTSIFSRYLVSDLENTQYFKIIETTSHEAVATNYMQTGKTLFVLNIPSDFSKDLIQEKQPHVLLEADGTDPVAITNAINAARVVVQNYVDHYFTGALDYLKNVKDAFFLDVQINYNPGLVSQYHTLPGLLVVIISITLPLITAISIVREYELGTMESLLTTPVRPLDIIIGKVVPLILLGYILFLLVLTSSYYLFNLPFQGSLILYIFLAFPYFIANVGIGLMAATVSRNLLRAANVTNTYVLPATLFSGFLFPFYGMPVWAQIIGNIFPPAHFLRITSGIMLKGATFDEIWHDLWPILIFMVVTFYIAIRYYRRTLD